LLPYSFLSLSKQEFLFFSKKSPEFQNKKYHLQIVAKKIFLQKNLSSEFWVKAKPIKNSGDT